MMPDLEGLMAATFVACAIIGIVILAFLAIPDCPPGSVMVRGAFWYVCVEEARP
jgi:hypothetical protein